MGGPGRGRVKVEETVGRIVKGQNAGSCNQIAIAEHSQQAHWSLTGHWGQELLAHTRSRRRLHCHAEHRGCAAVS